MFCDSHCHLADAAFQADFQDTLNRAQSAGIDFFVTIGAGSELLGNEKVVKIAAAYENIYASIGIHPHDAKVWNEKTSQSLKTLTGETHKNEKIVAWGEIGLDYHYMNSQKEVQKKAFVEQIHLAFELDLPIVIHSREAEEDTVKILKENRDKIHQIDIHCFTGGPDFAQALKPLDAYLGVGGIITFNSAKNIRQALSQYPLDRLLLETDCPYLAPVPHRGKRNEPGYIPLIAKKLAEVTNTSVETIAKQTSLNAGNFFGIQRLGSTQTMD